MTIHELPQRPGIARAYARNEFMIRHGCTHIVLTIVCGIAHNNTMRAENAPSIAYDDVTRITDAPA
jgi:hypothetical protein